MSNATDEYLLTILLRGGQYVPVRLDKTSMDKALNLLITMMNDPTNPQHRVFQTKAASGLPMVVFMEEIAAFYVTPYSPSPQDRIARAFEKQVDEGEHWKPDE